MGTTPQADISENVYHHTLPVLASRASNAADALVPLMGPGQQIDILSAWMVPASSQAGSATNYADIKIINLGTGSAGTTVLASKSFSATGASVAANELGSFALAATVSKASNHHLAVSYASAGNGIALVPHAIHLAYRYT